MPSAVAVDFPEATLSGLPILTPYGVAGFIPASKVVFKEYIISLRLQESGLAARADALGGCSRFFGGHALRHSAGLRLAHDCE